jgi:hypothetical protein
MASVVQHILVCDVDEETDGTQTYLVSLDGKGGEVELCPRDRAALKKVAARYIAKARRVPRQRRGPGRTTESRQHSREVRDWAREAGIHVSDRGRIPADVVDQYEASPEARGRTR